MKCKNLRIRSKNYKRYGYCVKYKKQVNIFCKECKNNIEYPKPKLIKSRTYKQVKKERKRFSIITDTLDYCFVCHKPSIHKHEVFFGKNRNNSIKYGLVVPLCYDHHKGDYGVHGKHGCALDLKLKIIGQQFFEGSYPHLDFIELFHENYIKQKKKKQ